MPLSKDTKPNKTTTTEYEPLYPQQLLVKLFNNCFSWPSQLGLQNTLTASLQRSKTPLMSVLISYKAI